MPGTTTPAEVTSKVCLGCFTDKPLDEYGKDAKGKHGRRARCKTCMTGSTPAPAPQPVAEMDVHVIYNPNGTAKAAGLEVRVHRAGCRDIPRDLRGSTSNYEITVSTQREAAEDFYSDFIEEGSMTAGHAMDLTDFLPCTAGLPEGEPSQEHASEAAIEAAITAGEQAAQAPAKKPHRTDFYLTVITRPMTANHIAAALIQAGWDDEGMPKVVATLSYLVRRAGKLTVTDGAAPVYAPVR